MAAYFSKYPKTIINNKLVTDIISRAFVRDKYGEKLSIYYPYNLQEGDTPEIIADKYYGDPERHWIVMLANDIVDPFFDFAMDSQVFEKYINEKYENEADSVNLWYNCNWRGNWDNREYAVIGGTYILESNTNVTYTQTDDGITYKHVYDTNSGNTYTCIKDKLDEDINVKINGDLYFVVDALLILENGTNITYTDEGGGNITEHVFDANTGITYSFTENGSDDHDAYVIYNTNDAVLYGNSAFYCLQTHVPSNFLDDLGKGYWKRILDGVYWKGFWQPNTDYYTDDVVVHNSTVYICTNDNLDNQNNHVTYSDGQFWKTYNNGVEYATVTKNKEPYSYRATIVTTDLVTDTSTTKEIYIDGKSFNGGEKGYDDDVFNYADSTIETNDISVITTKEMITIFQYESEKNEKKRQIKLIRREYVPQIEQEFKLLMGTYYG